jgi:hypothetical protein
MGTVFVDMAMSLDGFVSGPNGDDGGLHDWYFAPSGNAVGVIDELLYTIGAMIIGKRSFGDQPDGFDTPNNAWERRPRTALDGVCQSSGVSGGCGVDFGLRRTTT